MRKDEHLIFESYVDGVTRTRNALGGRIMSIVKYGIPTKREFIKIRQELHDKTKEIEARGSITEEEREWAREIIAKIRNYRSQHPDDPPPYNQEENAEDMSKSPFHYDPMTHLADAANQIYKILKSNSDDEARPEHIEKMAEIILGPQSEYSSVDHYKRALSGVIELLNHHVVVSMNEGEEMPSNVFNKLKQHINKGPIQIKKASKELPYTHKYIQPLAKQDPREGQKEENAESNGLNPAALRAEDLGNGYSVQFDEIREPDNRYYYIHLYKNLGNGKYSEITSFYPSGNDGDKMHSYVSAENPKSRQMVIDLINKYLENKLPSFGTKAENEERRIDPKCWKGYHKSGTKLKGGVRVNNCVKNS